MSKSTQTERKGIKSVLLLICVFSLTFFALLPAHAHNVVASVLPQASAISMQAIQERSMDRPAVIAKSAQLESKAAANSIIGLVSDLLPKADKPAVVKVPSSSFALVLQELQKRHVHVLSPGTPAPAEAKSVFLLQSECGSMIQTLYFY